jgi:hypothetical protein
VTVALYTGVVADSPTDAAEQVRVAVPNLTQMDRRTYGPVAFTPKISAAGAVRFPQRGDRAVIGVDTTGAGTDWLVTWGHEDSGPASPGGGASGDIFVRKTADETVNNSSVLQDDDHLTTAVAINTTYVVEAHVIYSSDASADIKYAWIIPAGATLSWSVRGPHFSTANGGAFGASDLATTTIPNGGLGVGSKVATHLMGLLIVGGTAGNLKLQWAQQGAAAFNTVVYTDSFLRLTKVA